MGTYNNMGRLIVYLLLIVFCVGCKNDECTIVDYNSYNYGVWLNDSDHTIRMLDTSVYPDERLNVEIAPGEEHIVMDIGMASTIFPGSSKMTVLFDGEYEVTFYSVYAEDETTQNLPVEYEEGFRLNLPDSYSKEVVKNPEGCSQCAGRRWTYVFTNADYDEAVEFNRTE